jgi:hypothetical protein
VLLQVRPGPVEIADTQPLPHRNGSCQSLPSNGGVLRHRNKLLVARHLGSALTGPPRRCCPERNFFSATSARRFARRGRQMSVFSAWQPSIAMRLTYQKCRCWTSMCWLSGTVKLQNYVLVPWLAWICTEWVSPAAVVARGVGPCKAFLEALINVDGEENVALLHG